MKSYKINILGTVYTVEFHSLEEDPKLEDLYGYCDYTTKTIVVSYLDHDDKEVGNMKCHFEHVLKHEMVHAFLYESGLMDASGWANNETIVDWIALQLDKIHNEFESNKWIIDKEVEVNK